MDNEQNELGVAIQESGIEISQATDILKKFNIFFEQAKEWEVKAKSLVVKDENDIETMSEARKARLILQRIRTDAERTRKELKENSLRTGKAIDGVANVIRALIIPIEEHLEKQEKFAEIIQMEAKAKKLSERTAMLLIYVEDVSFYNLEIMSDDAFSALVVSVKREFDERLEKEKLIEKKRIEDEIKQKEEDEKMRVENAKMKKDKEEREKKEEVENKKRQLSEKAKEEAHQKELAIERDKAKKIAEELKKKEEDENKRLAIEKKLDDERKEKERQSKLAPEKDKLFAYAEAIRTIKSPEDLSKAGLEVVKTIEAKLLAISQEVKLAIKNL